jgi:hypothetical protein
MSSTFRGMKRTLVTSKHDSPAFWQFFKLLYLINWNRPDPTKSHQLPLVWNFQWIYHRPKIHRKTVRYDGFNCFRTTLLLSNPSVVIPLQTRFSDQHGLTHNIFHIWKWIGCKKRQKTFLRHSAYHLQRWRNFSLPLWRFIFWTELNFG